MDSQTVHLEFRIYEILKDVIRELSEGEDLNQALPAGYHPDQDMEAAGLDPILLPEISKLLKVRLGGIDVSSKILSSPLPRTIGELVKRVALSLEIGVAHPKIAYVDDEEENIFVFKRKFGKNLDIITFTDPILARDAILKDPNIVLVITDESMPKMTGNQLCDEIRSIRPNIRFILITGNPANDDKLMYKSMRQGRFYDFINKPVDFEGKYEEMSELFKSLTSSNTFIPEVK